MKDEQKRGKNRKEKDSTKLKKRNRWDRFIRVCALISAFILFSPVLLLLIYKIGFIHPVSTLMVKEKLFGVGAKREWVDIENVKPVLYQTIMISEDGQFCAHNGVDWDALNAVIEDAIDGRKTRGASTITMQLVKNLFLWNSRSYIRKGLEIPLALTAELILSKKRIMEIYLNVAEFDEGLFGVELAAQRYFKRSSAKVGPRQSSLLAVTLPNPKKRNAAKPTRSMNRVAKIVQSRARKAGPYVKCLN